MAVSAIPVNRLQRDDRSFFIFFSSSFLLKKCIVGCLLEFFISFVFHLSVLIMRKYRNRIVIYKKKKAIFLT
jgi:hypothetical protein